jgi:hypothetical protein
MWCRMSNMPKATPYASQFTEDCYKLLGDYEIVLALYNYPCPDRTKQKQFGYCLVTNQGVSPVVKFPIKGWFIQSLVVILKVVEDLDPRYTKVYTRPKQLIWGVYNSPLRKYVSGKRLYYHEISKKILKLLQDSNVQLLSANTGSNQAKCFWLGIDYITKVLGRVNATEL